MRALVASLLLTVLAGCASTQQVTTGTSGCDRVASLAQAGEYKPAVDEMATLAARGVACRRRVGSAVKRSQRKLDKADTYLLRSQEKRQHGDLAGARRDLTAALEVYPKYYWAQRQLRNFERQSDPEAMEAGLMQRKIAEHNLMLARQAEERDDLTRATELALQAMDPAPHDPDLRADLVEYARLLGLKLFSDGELTPASDLWGRALELDADNVKLRQYLREVDQRLDSLEAIKADANGSSRL